MQDTKSHTSPPGVDEKACLLKGPNGKMLNDTHYILLGPEDGKRLVCVHGIGGSLLAFQAFAEYISAKGYRVLIYDLIGRGFSPMPSDNLFTGEAHLQQLRTLLTSLDFHKQPFHLMGHSMGGVIATLYAEQHLDEILSLTLLAPAGMIPSIPIRVVRALGSVCCCIHSMIKSNLLHNQESVWEGELYREDGVFKERSDKFVQAQKDQQKLRPNRFDAFYECIKYFPLYGIEASVRAVGARQGLPIHVLWGDHDTMVPYEDGIAKWRRQLEGSACKATFYVQKDAGHSLLIEYPEETSAALYAYLENVS